MSDAAEAIVAELIRENMPHPTTKRLLYSARTDAISVAVTSSQHGDRITVHDIECPASDDAECTCEPIALVVQ